VSAAYFVRPSGPPDGLWAVDCYDGSGRWTATICGLTRDKAFREARRLRARARRKAVRKAEYARMAIYGLSPNPILRDVSFVPGEPAPRRHPLPGLTYRTINPDPLGGGG
jgi:hypothetical protein